MTEILPDLIPGTSTIIEATAETERETVNDRDQHNVLAEIAQMDNASQATAIADLIRHAHHADPMVRATVAMTLGEQVAQNPGHQPTEWVAILNQLLQDSHAEVRLQAATALGKMQRPVDLTS
jgi:HEAT repeat protein